MSNNNPTIKTGSILISAPSLEDPYFDKVVIYIAEYNEKGALGFVMNQIFERTFNELTEFRTSKPFPLHEGGPVERESLYFIHRVPDHIQEGRPIADGVYIAGNFKQAVDYLNTANDAESNLRLFIGYSGWDANQLDDEIKEGSWLIVEASVTTIFETAEASLWEVLHKRVNSL
ncbi:YqgE/AlgH family protein [Niastella sp. OAS944]|uniref:YqgE/AlgH family protein n=1 Tax=Niastella sp. OAS944 TaxID=2664089 RepID=UPI003469B087|nr:putative transcriptional regulator [Chitinophagaceae bacterium OAS944]